MLELVVKHNVVVPARATSTSILRLRLLYTATTTVVTTLRVLRNLIGRLAATRVSGLAIDCSAISTLLLPPVCIFSYGICILGTCKSILLYLLFLLWCVGPWREALGCIVKIGGIMPTMRTSFPAAVTLSIKLLFLRVPKFTITGPAAGRSRLRRQRYTRCIGVLSLFQRSVIEGRVR